MGFARAMRRMAAPVDAGLERRRRCSTPAAPAATAPAPSTSRPSRRSWWPARACTSPSTATARSPASAAAPTCWKRWASTSPCRPSESARAIREVGIGFLFAPAVHTAMKHAQPVRVDLKMRTVFNLLGPLTNPAGATAQLVGRALGARRRTDGRRAGRPRTAARLRGARLRRPGRDHHHRSDAGLRDPRRAEWRRATLEPEDFGVRPSTPEDLKGGDRARQPRNRRRGPARGARSAARHRPGECRGGAGRRGQGGHFPGRHGRRSGLHRFRRGARQGGGAGRVQVATSSPASSRLKLGTAILPQLGERRTIHYRGGYLAPFSLKMLNSSSKSEFIDAAAACRMYVHHHLPGGLEDGFRSKPLPVLDIEGPVHLGNAPVSFHHECRLRLIRFSDHAFIVRALPRVVTFRSLDCSTLRRNGRSLKRQGSPADPQETPRTRPGPGRPQSLCQSRAWPAELPVARAGGGARRLESAAGTRQISCASSAPT